MEDYVRCPRCGGDTPGENLNCIYCGAVLPSTAGVFGAMRYGVKGLFCSAVALAVILALLAWLILR